MNARQAGYRFGYVRVSTSKQEGKAQREQLEAAGIAAEDIEEDHGRTGTTMSRPSLEKLTGAWSQDYERFIGGRMREGDVLTVTMLDRLGRNTREMLEFAERLKASKMNLHILNMSIDTSTPGGELLYTVMSAIATMESRIKAERARNGVQQRRDRGEKVGGRPKAYSDEPIRKKAKQVQQGVLSAAQAARELGISRSTLYKRADEMGLSLKARAERA